MTEFTFKKRHATLEAFVDVSMFFKNGDLEKVEIKHEDEVLILSSTMFFALLGNDAHMLYEEAAEAEQNERLKS